MTTAIRYDVNLSMLFTELPLLQRPAAAAAAGFDAIEYWWPFTSAVPADAELDAFADAVTDAGVQLIGLNFFAGDMPGGDRGLVSWPARSSEFRDNIDVTIATRRAIGLQGFQRPLREPRRRLDTGGAGCRRRREPGTGGGGGIPDRRDGAARTGERRTTYPLLTAGDVADVWTGSSGNRAPRTSFLCDLYHLQTNGDDVAAAIGAYASRIGHVQIADSPGPERARNRRPRHLRSSRRADSGRLRAATSDWSTNPAAALWTVSSWLPRESRASRS